MVSTDESVEVMGAQADEDGPGDFEGWYADAVGRVGRAVAVATGELDVSADATAEAFSRALERWDRVRAMRNPDGWVYRVAFNDARRRLGRLRRPFRQRDPDRHAADPADLVPDHQLWDAVRALPTRQRQAIALRYVIGLDERGVADAMGVSEGAASSALATARARLREVLEDER